MILIIIIGARFGGKKKKSSESLIKRGLWWFFKLLFKMLFDKEDEIEDIYDEHDFKEEIIALDENDVKQPVIRRPENQIREIYRDFLNFVKTKATVDTSLHLTSKEIENEIVSRFGSETSSAFRDEYIKVRYNESEFTKDDVKQMKELYKNVKKEINHDLPMMDGSLIDYFLGQKNKWG